MIFKQAVEVAQAMFVFFIASTPKVCPRGEWKGIKRNLSEKSLNTFTRLSSTSSSPDSCRCFTKI